MFSAGAGESTCHCPMRSQDGVYKLMPSEGAHVRIERSGGPVRIVPPALIGHQDISKLYLESNYSGRKASLRVHGGLLDISIQLLFVSEGLASSPIEPSPKKFKVAPEPESPMGVKREAGEPEVDAVAGGMMAPSVQPCAGPTCDGGDGENSGAAASDAASMVQSLGAALAAVPGDDFDEEAFQPEVQPEG